MPCTERAITFRRGGEQLVGIVSVPRDRPLCEVGVVIVVGGPQYRVGSHRQFVLLARALADAGHAVLRFDLHGMGDSTGRLEDFEHATPDIAQAIDALQNEVPGVRQTVLWGLCDGASAALLYCQTTSDPRVTGLCLANPWVRSATSLARTRVKHYYLQRLRERAFWQKLLKGEVALQAVAELLRMLRQSRQGGARAPQSSGEASSPFQARMAQGWHDFPGSILLLLSEDDYTAKEFGEYTAADPRWDKAFKRRTASRHVLPEADHTFSRGASLVHANTLTIDWLATLRHRPVRSATVAPDPA